MSRSLIDVMKVLAAGFMMAILAFAAADHGAASAPAEHTARALHIEFAGSRERLDAFCHHQAPKKHHCQRLLLTTAAIIEPSAKRKQSDPIAIPATFRPVVVSRSDRTGFSGDRHLRLSFNAVYATTRRMHI